MSVVTRSGMAVVIAGVALLALAAVGEFSDAFLYAGYVTVRIVASSCAAVLFVWAFILSKGRDPAPLVAALSIDVVVVIVAYALPRLATTARKEFFVKASEVRQGMRCQDASVLLRSYERWSYEPDYVTFAYQSRPGTVDVVVIHCDVKTSRIIDADVSLD